MRNDGRPATHSEQAQRPRTRPMSPQRTTGSTSGQTCPRGGDTRDAPHQLVLIELGPRLLQCSLGRARARCFLVDLRHRRGCSATPGCKAPRHAARLCSELPPGGCVLAKAGGEVELINHGILPTLPFIVPGNAAASGTTVQAATDEVPRAGRRGSRNGWRAALRHYPPVPFHLHACRTPWLRACRRLALSRPQLAVQLISLGLEALDAGALVLQVNREPCQQVLRHPSRASAPPSGARW